MKDRILTISFMTVCIVIAISILSINGTVDAAKPATVNLTVIVVDAIYDYPIEGAEVNVYGTNHYNGFTQKNGEAYFPGIANDNYCIDASYRSKYGHDSVYLVDTTITVTLYISTGDSLCP